MPASASIPPTPQPSTPRPLIIVVCESVPTRVSGRATGPSASSLSRTHVARYSRFTWWMMPVAGGTTRKPAKAFWPQRRNSYLSRFRSNSISAFRRAASGEPKTSTCTEWSTTRSTGTSGLIHFGSWPRRSTAARSEARSTTAGTPVKSCKMTRAGVKGSSPAPVPDASQAARLLTSSSVTSSPSTLRRTDSRRILIENGSRSRSRATPSFSRASSRYRVDRPWPVSNVERAPNTSVFMASLSWLRNAPRRGSATAGRLQRLHHSGDRAR